jgi:hypothetical protein
MIGISLNFKPTTIVLESIVIIAVIGIGINVYLKIIEGNHR